ncbi:barstar family protein [Actinokineospora sp. UTMC 2448]|uniref:barstar family protein n=1 Tax=Actinokineospora sp. UTMC 2448 TaxID=2268449 RepID=UPI0021643857|nr:barstar family protein [Actinokineospora sp. UTMC 2448]
MRVEIDGRKIGSVAEFHREIAAALDFGPYYGANLDALWDRLYRDVPRPVRLIWTHASHSREALGERDFGRIVDLINKVVAYDIRDNESDRFEFEMTVD